MKYLPTYKQKLYFYDTLTFWVIRLIMLVLKLKNDLLLLMKNFKIIFLKQTILKVLNNKIQTQKKVLFKHIVDIRIFKCVAMFYIATLYFNFLVILLYLFKLQKFFFFF